MPHARPRLVETAPRPAAQTPPQRILVADDNVDLLHLLARRAFGETTEVHSALSGDLALELVKQFAFDLLLLDVSMPGLDGLDVTRRVRTLDIRQPAIVLISAFPDDHAVHEAVDAGADGVLRKPFSLDALRATLADVLPPG